MLVRSCSYLNNLVEQDHRAIKRRCAPMLGFKSIETAAITLSGVELAHRIHKEQFHFGRGPQRRHSSLKELWDRALAHPQASGLRPAAAQISTRASANAPELTSQNSGEERLSNHRAEALFTVNFRWPRSLYAGDAERRSILAL